MKKEIINKQLKFWVWLLIASQTLFWIGFHNVDWSVNMSKLNIHMYYASNQTEEEFFKDRATSGGLWSYSNGYRYGLLFMVSGMLLSFASGYNIGKET